MTYAATYLLSFATTPSADVIGSLRTRIDSRARSAFDLSLLLSRVFNKVRRNVQGMHSPRAAYLTNDAEIEEMLIDKRL